MQTKTKQNEDLAHDQKFEHRSGDASTLLADTSAGIRDAAWRDLEEKLANRKHDRDHCGESPDYHTPKPHTKHRQPKREKEKKGGNVKRKKGRSRRPKARFDSTLGFPGEGPGSDEQDVELQEFKQMKDNKEDPWAGEDLRPFDAFDIDSSEVKQPEAKVSPKQKPKSLGGMKRRVNPPRAPSVCNYCESPDHLVAQCPTYPCNICSGFGHRPQQCKKRPVITTKRTWKKKVKPVRSEGISLMSLAGVSSADALSQLPSQQQVQNSVVLQPLVVDSSNSPVVLNPITLSLDQPVVSRLPPALPSTPHPAPPAQVINVVQPRVNQLAQQVAQPPIPVPQVAPAGNPQPGGGGVVQRRNNQPAPPGPPRGPRPPPPPPPPPPPQPQPPAVVNVDDRGDVLAGIERDLRSKCQTSLLTKDLSCKDDMDVVKRQMCSVARLADIHEYTLEHVDSLVLRIFREEHANVTRSRLETSKKMMSTTETYSLRRHIYHLRKGGKIVDLDSIAVENSPISAIKLFESGEPYTVFTGLLAWLVHWSYISAVLILIPMFEEWSKERLEESSILNEHYGWLVTFQVHYLLLFYTLLLAVLESRYSDYRPLAVLWRVVAHYLLAFIPYTFAVPCHVTWNMVAWQAGCSNVMLSIGWQDLRDTHTRLRADVCCQDHRVKKVEVQDDFEMDQGDGDGERELCKPSFGSRTLWGIFGFIPMVYRSCIHNETVSLCGRVGKKLPMHISDALADSVRRRWRAASNTVIPLMTSLIRRTRRMSFKTWVTGFVPRRRDQLVRLNKLGFDKYSRTASGFVKREIAISCVDDCIEGEPIKDPRWIQGCPLELSIEAGPSLRPFAKAVRQGLRPKNFSKYDIADGRQIIYTCGLSNESIGDQFAKATRCIESLCGPGERVVFLEDDQSRFDLHITRGAFGFLSGIYRHFLPRRVVSALRRLISRGRSVFGTKYQVPFTMQSGWPDTSVGDTLVNACMKYSIQGVGRKWISIICGDDSVTITTDKEIETMGGSAGIIASYAEFGMEVEVNITRNPLDVGFCSGRFMPVGETYLLVPKVGRLLAKLCSDQVDRSPANQIAWLRGIQATLAHYGQHDPLCLALANMLHRECGVGKVIVDIWTEYRHRYDGTIAYDEKEVQHYYAHHYGFSVSDIAMVARIIEESSVGALVRNSKLIHLVKCDC